MGVVWATSEKGVGGACCTIKPSTDVKPDQSCLPTGSHRQPALLLLLLPQPKLIFGFNLLFSLFFVWLLFFTQIQLNACGVYLARHLTSALPVDVDCKERTMKEIRSRGGRRRNRARRLSDNRTFWPQDKLCVRNGNRAANQHRHRHRQSVSATGCSRCFWARSPNASSFFSPTSSSPRFPCECVCV